MVTATLVGVEYLPCCEVGCVVVGFSWSIPGYDDWDVYELDNPLRVIEAARRTRMRVVPVVNDEVMARVVASLGFDPVYMARDRVTEYSMVVVVRLGPKWVLTYSPYIMCESDEAELLRGLGIEPRCEPGLDEADEPPLDL